MSYNLQHVSGANGALGSAGLAEGTNANTLQFARAFSFAIGGLGYYKAATDNIAFTAHAVQAALTTCLYLVQINKDGTVSTKKGVAQANDSGEALVWPQPDAGNVAVGGFKIRCNNAATFTAGSTDLGAADVVDTAYDFILGGPPQGLVA